MQNFTGAPPQLLILVALVAVVGFLYVRHVKVNNKKLNAFFQASPEEQEKYTHKELRQLQKFARSRVSRRATETSEWYREAAEALGEWLDR